MARWDYDEALSELLKSEGGYTNHPRDPGGPTNFGITIHDYRAYVKPTATANDIRNMKLPQAVAIYKAKYWDAVWGDELPPGLDYAVFDFGVNSGVNRAVKYLQRIVGVDDDGVMGPITLDAVHSYSTKHGAKALEDLYNARRMAFLRRLKTWATFGRGWGARVAKVDRLADDMRDHPAKYGMPPDVEPVPQKQEEQSIFATLFSAFIQFIKSIVNK